MATEPQINFVSSLVRERVATIGGDGATYDDVLAAVLARLTPLGTRDTSIFIDRLKAMPRDPNPAMPDVVAASPRSGVNSRDGQCATCNGLVPANAGFYYKGEGDYGKWLIHHKVGECSDTPIQTTSKVLEQGIFKVGDTIVKVSTTGTGRLGGWVLSDKGKWVYTKGSAQSTLLGVKLSAEEAAAYGKLHKRCIACGINLKDEGDNRSIDRGYGPVCATKNGWPWG